jgi:hypothetical protein
MKTYFYLGIVWLENFEAIYSKSKSPDQIIANLNNIARQFEECSNFHSACKQSSQLVPYYQMWTKLFDLRWDIPLEKGIGKIEISLKLPYFGFPPHAFVDSNSDPVLPSLSILRWWNKPVDDFPKKKYGYFADDVLQATALHRYLSNKGQLMSLKFVVMLLID